MSTIERLLKKIELDLQKAIDSSEAGISVVDEGAVYCRTLARLREAGIEIAVGDDDAKTREVASQYEDIFAECYHQLLELEKTRALTTVEAPLLNDLDEFEDYLIRE